MVIALNEVLDGHLLLRGATLAVVAVAITIAVCGVVGLIVKMDDIGLHMAKRGSRGRQEVGRGLVALMPRLLGALATIGTAAMLWVGGQRSDEHTSELQALMRISYAVFCLNKKQSTRYITRQALSTSRYNS